MKRINHTLSRWMYAVPFIIFGLFHFLSAEMLAEAVPEFIPGSVFWVYLTGVALILAGISIIIEKYTNLACRLLALMLLIFVLTIALPQVIGGNQMMMLELLKDLSLAGAALFIGGQYESAEVMQPSSDAKTAKTNLQ